ncbi:hypothetical protein B0T20DRAFT_145841 [Sordaria brevicollis]|uniref:Uncharacterized protein n=1 Tax=Sordaria brevicollis TaxID=83679 RepID=A0AAE0UDR4_SORBR|nr:hypothetical protein B0T20DRAFT_145841 [Sordaria brevicollis]
MPARCQTIQEEPAVSDASPPDLDRSCTAGQHIPTHPLPVYPQYVYFGSGLTAVGLDPLTIAPSSDGALKSVFPVPTAMAPSLPLHQQTISHVLLPVVASSCQWQQPICRWAMPSIQQETTTWIIQSPVAAAQGSEARLCHPSQASCCQHLSQFGHLHPEEDDTGCTSESLARNTATNQHTNHASTPNVERTTSSSMNPRPDLAEILNKVMINTSDKLMALLDEELDRMEEEGEEFSDLEEMDTTSTQTVDSPRTAD